MPPRKRKSPPPVDAENAPAVLAAPATPAAAPIPSSYKLEWFPAMVRVPDQAQPFRLAKVYATPQGLYVYTRCPSQSDRATGGTPAWWSPIDYAKTPRPATGYAARDAGIRIHTDAGQVIVQPLGGCGCQSGALKAWRPAWASRNEAWENQS